MQKHNVKIRIADAAPYIINKGVDPEMLFVECAKCGNPIIWEPGRSTEILQGAGIDPIELDSQCLLVTDGCPKCSRDKHYHVQIFRVQSNTASLSSMAKVGHA